MRRAGELGALLVTVVLVATACGDSGGSTSTTSPAAPVTTVAASTTTTVGTTTTARVGATTTPPVPTTTTTMAAGPEPPFDTWTVILASKRTEDEARAVLGELDPPDAGILVSDDYPSLNPGFWVVYSGVFRTAFSAQRHCEGLGTECYHRYLGPATDVAPVRANGQALLWVQTDFLLDLVAVSLDSGGVVRTIVTERGEAEFPGPPYISPDGASALLTIGFEDFWFSCEGVLGETFRVDLASGRVSDFAPGIRPRFSRDGRYVAWLEASECLEDPEEPAFFIAYFDTIVVRDLASGSERRWRPGPALASTGEGEVQSIGWSADSERIYFTWPDGTMRELRVDAPETTRLDDLQPIPLFGFPDGAFLDPLGQLADGLLVMRWSIFANDEFRDGLDLYDLATGERNPLYESDRFVEAALDREHTAVAWAEGSRLRSVGAIEVDVDVGLTIEGIGW